MSVDPHAVFKQGVQNINQLQQHTIKICCEMIRSPYQWIPAANHFISSMKQSLARQCWSKNSLIAWVFAIVLQWTVGGKAGRRGPSFLHDNLLAYPPGAFVVIFDVRSAVRLLVYLEKMCF